MMKKNNCRKNSKAQMQVSETIFAAIAIIIIIVIGLVFYSKAKAGSMEEEAEKARTERLVELAHTLSSWPELECSVRETREFDCFDVVKLDVLTEILGSGSVASGYSFNYYYDLLGRSRITVSKVYPPSDQRSWTVYEKNGTSRSEKTIVLPVSLYDPIKKKYSLGVMEFKMYE